ncbi:hypothetical protein BC827DRAFT_1154908 [Russula dissimulans]|nr:hypothetical protein BC827DRAFT_1154908 [Russula dissimulans]
MVNFHDPVVAATIARAHVTISSAACGLYIWELFTHLGYEWSVIKGHRPYRWTIWVYSAVHLATLIAVIIELVTWTIATRINYLRIYDIFLVFAIDYAPHIHAKWVPPSLACGPPNTQSTKLAITTMPFTDITLLVIMLIGLLRLRHRGGGRFDLGRLLWKQGVIYLLVATIAEIPPVVSIYLDLNLLILPQLPAAFDLMFLMPSLITMSIAATRMYRSLSDFGFSVDMYGGLIPSLSGTHFCVRRCSGNSSDNSQKRLATNAKWTTTIPLSPNRMEVAIHTSYESSTSPTAQYVAYMTSDGQNGNKPREINLNNDVESNATREK